VDAAEGGVMLTTRDVTIETMPTGQPGEHIMRVDVHLTRWTRLRMTWDVWWRVAQRQGLWRTIRQTPRHLPRQLWWALR